MELNDYLTYSISLAAIVISIIVFIQNQRNSERQLRIGRIEEMIEIIHILNLNYNFFFDTFSFKKNVFSDLKEEDDEKKYFKQLKGLIEISDTIELQNKLTRLYVLNNSYLPRKELKNKIGILIALFSSIAGSTISQPIKEEYLPFNKFPKPWEFLDFAEEIQNELLEEMNLGYKKNFSRTNSYEEKFKERFNL